MKLFNTINSASWNLITFSRIFVIPDNKFMARYECGELGCLPGFSTGIILDSLNILGKTKRQF